jgi:hypothetical protein
MRWVNNHALEYYIPSASLKKKREGGLRTRRVLPKIFNVKPDWCESTRHGSDAYRRNATFVEGHLDRIPPFHLMLRIGRRASESQGSHMKRLIATSREQQSLGSNSCLCTH